MPPPRIYTGQPLQTGTELSLEATAVRHLVQVLRLKPGAEVSLFNGDGYDYTGRLTEVSRRSALAVVESRGEAEAEPALQIHLGIGLSKGDRMDFAIQKAVELGISGITPLISEHCVVRLPAERLEKKLQHWRQVVIAACEQCGRRRIPRCHEIATLPDWLASGATGYGLLLDHRSERSLPQLNPPARKVSLLIGPEGGLSETEQALASTAGFNGVRLGPRVLRTETAPLAAIAAIQALWGDFR